MHGRGPKDFCKWPRTPMSRASGRLASPHPAPSRAPAQTWPIRHRRRMHSTNCSAPPCKCRLWKRSSQRRGLLPRAACCRAQVRRSRQRRCGARCSPGVCSSGSPNPSILHNWGPRNPQLHEPGPPNPSASPSISSIVSACASPLDTPSPHSASRVKKPGAPPPASKFCC